MGRTQVGGASPVPPSLGNASASYPPFTWLLKGRAPDPRLFKAEGWLQAAAVLRLLGEEWTR